MKHLFLLLPALLPAACHKAPAEEAASPEPVALVHTAPAERGAMTETAAVYGATEPAPGGTHALTTPAEAVVASIDAPVGTAVRRGQAIITLRPAPVARTEIARAASEAGAARAAYQRAMRLRADGLVSDGDVETARAAASVAEAARVNLGMAAGGLVLRAPSAGTVQGITAKPGDQLAAGTTVANIVAAGDLRARFGIDPGLVARIRVGQTAHVEPMTGGSAIDAPVVGIDPQVDPATRLAAMFVRLPASLRLAAGAPLRADFSLGAGATGIVIPYAALLDDGGRSYVFVVEGGVAHRREVSPGGSAGDRIQIRGGLKPGDRVVTEGGTALEDGMKVREGARQ